MKKVALLLVLLSFAVTSTSFAQTFELGNGKDYGIAVNPFLALFGWFSGEVNIWKLDRTGEINIPIQIAHDPFGLDGEDYSINVYSVGTYYRKFFNRSQKGFFVQGGWLYTHADAELRYSHEQVSVSSNMHSMLFGVGYRLISETNGLFWATGFGVGRGWGTIEDPVGGEIRGSGVAFDVDLLKIGYSW